MLRGGGDRFVARALRSCACVCFRAWLTEPHGREEEVVGACRAVLYVAGGGRSRRELLLLPKEVSDRCRRRR